MNTEATGQNASADGKLKIQRILWGALLAAQLIYCGVVFLLFDETTTRTDLPEALHPIRLVLAGTALGALALAAIIPKLMLRSAIARRRAADPRPPLPAQMAEMSLVPSLIRWVLLETVTLNGFALAMIQRDPRQILPFFAVAFVALALSYPSERAIRQPFAEVYGS